MLVLKGILEIVLKQFTTLFQYNLAYRDFLVVFYPSALKISQGQLLAATKLGNLGKHISIQYKMPTVKHGLLY